MKTWRLPHSISHLLIWSASSRSFSTGFVASTTRPYSSFRRQKPFIMSSAAATNNNDNVTTPPSQQQHVVIAGAGIIGLSTAYYLHKQHHGIQTTVVDLTGTIAPAASGKAGGFLALDWNDASPTGPLTRRSFALHQELANELGADFIQYRRLTCVALVVDPYRSKPSGKKLETVEWADTASGAVLGMRPLGDESTIAQVHPRMLCERLWQEVGQKSDNHGHAAQLVKGKVVDVARDDNGKLVGAVLQDGSTIECDKILLACGPWTAQPSNIMSGIKYHSVVVPTDKVLTQCVFFSGCGDPEVYVRPDKTAYCTGYPDPPIRVTEAPGQEEIRADKVETILESVRDAAGKTSSGGKLSHEPLLEQACYLPSTTDGIPLMGELAHESGVFVSTGHTCWGK